ncbi:hypothetical protein [Helicobacter canis]|uniref:hypothetical protein n=1 Tax=Helicobacter canis TaxID=29419 RepID=UPI0026EA441D|nr:hypothetical protein [Helicobacter canis]
MFNDLFMLMQGHKRCAKLVLCATMGLCLIANASESDLSDPLESAQEQHATAQQEAQKPLSQGKLDSSSKAQTPSSPTKDSNPKDKLESSQIDRVIMEVGNMDDFLAVQKNFPWIRSVGLVMVSFDDGSFRSGFGLLLPNNLFLTSAELGHNASAYPKNILLKMRDESAGSLICLAELRLKVLDKVQGLSLFEVSGYTDAHCNLRSQSYYHSKILDESAYDIASTKPVRTNDYYTVTTTFNNPNISIITLKNNAKQLPIKNAQKIIFGRPFFTKDGQLLGMTTIPRNATAPVIVSYKEIKDFLCSIDKSGFYVSSFVQDLCRKPNATKKAR